jgi:hypothetical protein
MLLLSQKEIFVKVLDLGFVTLTKCYLFVYPQLWVWSNAVLMHTGYYTPTATPPPHSVSELQATIQILPPQETYTSMLRNSLRSRAWGGGSGCSYRVESCRIIKVGVEPFLGI